MNVVSNRVLYLSMTGALDLLNDALKVALMTNLYTPDKDTNTWTATNEASGTGYVTGGAVLSGSSVTQDNSGDKCVWDASDAEWPVATITARYAVIYNTTRSNTIVTVFDFGTDLSASGGLFAVRWNAIGITALAQV